MEDMLSKSNPARRYLVSVRVFKESFNSWKEEYHVRRIDLLGICCVGGWIGQRQSWRCEGGFEEGTKNITFDKSQSIERPLRVSMHKSFALNVS
jgi:hypothetical protein